jgi:arginyl-tRNA synthetase
MWFLVLNIVISDEYYLNSFNRMKDDTKFGFVNPEDTAVMVEYSSPNTNKPSVMFVTIYSVIL